MSKPFGPSVLSTEAELSRLPLAARGAGAGVARLGPLDAGMTVWDAAGPLTPIVLSETERRFRFRGLPQAVGAARRSLREWEEHFEPELFYDISLCVSELVTKGVQNGGSTGVEEIELGVYRDERSVRAEVLERRADVAVGMSARMNSEDWGMFIVDRVADRWGVERGIGTLVWCEFNLAADGRSRSRA